MDIAFSYYLTKKIELQEKKKPKYTVIRESCVNCGQQGYWCQCSNQKLSNQKLSNHMYANKKTEKSTITRMIRSYSYSSDSSD